MQEDGTKEIVSLVLKEIDRSKNASLTVCNDIATIEGLDLADGRSIDVDIQFNGIWDDGAFDYEYGSEKGTHRYPVQFSIDGYNIEEVRAADTNIVIWSYTKGGLTLKDFNVNMWQEVEKHWDSITTTIEQQAEPPEHDFDDRDDDR